MNGRFRIGALRDLYAQPLYRMLKSSPDVSGELLFDTPAAHIDRLMLKELDAAFVAPMDFAMNSSDLIIFPGVGVSSAGFSGVVRLYLRDQLKAITTMAVGAVTTTDVITTRIILGEKYDAAPAIIPVAGTVEEMLAKADCALVAGEPLHSIRSDRPFLDMIDEWSDVTELPFVHTFCVARSEEINKELGDLLITSQLAGKMELPSVADDLAKDSSLSPEYLSHFFSHFSFGLEETAKQSLEAFMQLAFYHGMLGDVPEVRIG